jgi:tRNA dimethylallyltransferase
MTPLLIVVLGPTAVGKTELTLSIAEKLSCPILNCDSRQIYKDMRIGTAAPTEEQKRRVKHYFVGDLVLDDYYSAAKYESDVLNLTSELFETHNTLILSGGSMMYIDAVCNGIDDIPTIDDEVRNNLAERLKNEGIEKLLAELKIIESLQGGPDENADAIDYLLNGRYYMSASGPVYNTQANQSGNESAIRCVRDAYE